MPSLAAAGAFAALAAHAVSALTVPPNAVLIDRFAINVGAAFRNATDAFNPSNTRAPFFQVFDPAFLAVLGPRPRVRLIGENDALDFAHEAPIWHPPTDSFFFCSGAGAPPTSVNVTNQVSVFHVGEAARTGTANFSTIRTTIPLDMTNGGTPFDGDLLFVNSGRGDLPSTVTRVNPLPPHNVTVLLNSFRGRQFNSLNDVKVRRATNNIFFTDSIYGFLLGFRPQPALPAQVYRYDPKTGDVRVAATDFIAVNGIAFSPDGKTAYVSDTAANEAEQGFDGTRPSTIYAYDVDPASEAFANRRVFAYADTGIPDGIEVDTAGNVYAGSGDGVDVYDPSGMLIGKIFLGSVSANMAFAGKGRMVVLAETKVFLVEFAADGVPLFF